MFRPSHQKSNISTSPYKTLRKEATPPRTPVPTNQIIITDFTFTEPAPQKKKKRCPLWMINKRYKNKNINEGNIFTSQGIVAPNPQMPRKHETLCRYENKIKTKKSSSANKKTTKVPFNFIRAKGQSLYKTINQVDCDMSLHFYHPRSRGLNSSLSERKNEQMRSSHRRVQSSSKLAEIKHNRYQWKNDLVGWNTVQLDYDDFV